ncbi:MAG TPA: NAD(P)H-dependent oxidoreductase [Ilumatobacteraceae bacterium]
MKNASPDELLAALHWRCAVKRFDPQRVIPEPTWHALEQALVLSPSSFNLQPWRFVVVHDREVRAELRTAAWNQPQVADASHFVVFAGMRTATIADVDRMIATTAAHRGVPVEHLARYRQVIASFVGGGWVARDGGAGWNARQVYIALGQFMTAAAMLGVDTSPLEGIDTVAYDRILGLDGTRYTSLCACAAGYRAANDTAAAAKWRYPPDELLERR